MKRFAKDMTVQCHRHLVRFSNKSGRWKRELWRCQYADHDDHEHITADRERWSTKRPPRKGKKGKR